MSSVPWWACEGECGSGDVPNCERNMCAHSDDSFRLRLSGAGMVKFRCDGKRGVWVAREREHAMWGRVGGEGHVRCRCVLLPGVLNGRLVRR